MTDQLRYNEGKPKLSYIFASQRALTHVESLFLGDDDPAPFTPEFVTRSTVVDRISLFLDGGDREFLVLAAVETLMLLSPDAGRVASLDDLYLQCADALAEVARVYEFGERKYERGNFRKGAPITTYLDSALRHLSKEGNDEESGLSHLAHAFWNLWQALDQPEWRDDRLPPVQTKLEEVFSKPSVFEYDPIACPITPGDFGQAESKVNLMDMSFEEAKQYLMASPKHQVKRRQHINTEGVYAYVSGKCCFVWNTTRGEFVTADFRKPTPDFSSSRFVAFDNQSPEPLVTTDSSQFELEIVKKDRDEWKKRALEAENTLELRRKNNNFCFPVRSDKERDECPF